MIKYDETVGDIYSLIKKMDDKGMSVNIQTNNILIPFYHRDNFITSFASQMSNPNASTIAERFKKTAAEQTLTEAASGYISTLSNLFMHKKKPLASGMPRTFQIVSPMLDSASFA